MVFIRIFLFLALCFLGTSSFSAEDLGAQIKAQEGELTVARTKAREARQAGKNQLADKLFESVSLREEQLERLKAQQRAAAKTVTSPPVRSSSPGLGVPEGTRVLSGSGHEGVYRGMLEDKVVIELDDGRTAYSSPSRVSYEIPEEQVTLRDRFNEPIRKTIRSGTELRYVSDLWNLGGGGERDVLPLGKVERVFSDGRVRLTSGALINKLSIKHIFYAIPFLGGAKILLNAADYVTSATPAQASTLGSPYMSEGGLEEFFKLPFERQQEILTIDSKFANYVNSLLEGVVKQSGGPPKNVTCDGDKVSFEVEPSDISSRSSRRVELTLSEGKIRQAQITEQWETHHPKMKIQFNDSGDVVRFHPEIPSLRGKPKSEVNRPMDFVSYQNVARGFSDGKGISNFINQSAAFPAYYTLISPQLAEQCAAASGVTNNGSVSPAGVGIGPTVK